MSKAPMPWVVLELKAIDDTIEVSYADDRDRTRSAGQETHPAPFLEPAWTAPGSEVDYLPNQVRLPADFEALFGEQLASYPPDRYGPHANGPIPLPVFVAPPPDRIDWRWEAWVGALLEERGIDLDVVQPVRLAGRPSKPGPRFQLPINVYALGAAAGLLLGRLGSQDWYQDEEVVRTHGLKLIELDPAGSVPPDADIVLLEANALRSANAQTMPPGLLLIALNRPDESGRIPPDPPPGASVLSVSDAVGLADDFIYSFFMGIIHDYPLHEAFKTAIREYAAPELAPLLVSDPAANQAMRMADAFDAIVEDGESLLWGIDPGNLVDEVDDPGRGRGLELRDESAERIRRADADWQEVRRAADEASNLEFNFNREVFGLVPLAWAAGSVDRARGARESVEEALRELAEDPAVVERVADRQQRRVDVTMQHRRSTNGGWAFDRIFPTRPLEVEGVYRVRVQVGRRSEESRMVGDVPPIDTLLPDPKDDAGHLLDIVMFEKDFELLSERLQQVHLPRLGGSRPADFLVKAPERAGTAELRIGVYHENQHLQSFTLTAVIGELENVTDQKSVEVRLDMARTARFANLDRFRRRALAIGVNRNPSGDHSIMLKRDDAVPRPIPWPDALVQGSTERFRAILADYADLAKDRPLDRPIGGDAVVTTDLDPLPTDGPSPEPAEVARFDDAIRRLADLGVELRNALLGTGDGQIQDILRQIRRAENETIQVARLDPNLVFPWAAVYDYPLAPATAGADPRPVCRGHPLDPDPPDPPARPVGCPHNPHREVYCLDGFWGVRNRIEQLVGVGGEARDEPASVATNGRTGRITVAAGISTTAVASMYESLKSRLSGGLSALTPADDLLSILWTSTSRPEVLAVVGHLQTNDVTGEPVGERILLAPKGSWTSWPPPARAWLMPDPILEGLVYEPRWEAPSPLVMLMACESGSLEVSDLTGFVKSFMAAGAGAVIGTESTIYASLAGRFVREVTLWMTEDDMTLGEAVQRFYRGLLDDRIPMPFTFTAVGNADLTFKPGDSHDA